MERRTGLERRIFKKQSRLDPRWDRRPHLYDGAGDFDGFVDRRGNSAVLEEDELEDELEEDELEEELELEDELEELDDDDEEDS